LNVVDFVTKLLLYANDVILIDRKLHSLYEYLLVLETFFMERGRDVKKSDTRFVIFFIVKRLDQTESTLKKRIQ